uniref:Transcription initiation factor IIA subunit 2 n=1 Tax=Rhabditophanes sp. KR3021 TaxID=114890 RepID=A0AC35TLK2_9BILA
MTYQMYRQTTLGQALDRTLDDMVKEGQISDGLKEKVLMTFDASINQALANKAKNKTTFKATKLRAYRYCDNVWSFVMNDVEFKDNVRPVEGSIERVKFVACEASSAKAKPTA